MTNFLGDTVDSWRLFNNQVLYPGIGQQVEQCEQRRKGSPGYIFHVFVDLFL